MAEDSRFSISRWSRMGCWTVFWRKEREWEGLIMELWNGHGNNMWFLSNSWITAIIKSSIKLLLRIVIKWDIAEGRRDGQWLWHVCCHLAFNCLVNAWVEHFGQMASWWHTSSGRETFLVPLNVSGRSIVFEILSKIRLLVYSQPGCWGRFRWLMK